MPELVRFTFFHTADRMPSGPGAEEGENLLSTCLISSLVSGSAEGSRNSRHFGGMGSF